jgi:tetratricopeptide (TPR) repeat protein
VIASALGDPSALALADEAVARLPDSADALLVRARVRRRAGQRQAALRDVEAGLALAPGDARLLELQGLLKMETGHRGGALIDLDRASTWGARGSMLLSRAEVLLALRRYRESVKDWTTAIEYDPEDARAYLGRAWALLFLGLTDRAMLDLEQASDWAGDNPRLLAGITLSYCGLLSVRPDRLGRAVRLARRTWAALRLAPPPAPPASKRAER